MNKAEGKLKIVEHLTLTEQEASALAAIKTAEGIPRYAALNAIRHLDMAHKIWDIDREMAVFRCLLAEEEAGKAIIAAVKYHKYEDANKLNIHKHWHKRAILPLLKTLFMSEPKFGDTIRRYSMTMNIDDKHPYIHTYLKVERNGTRLTAEVLPPFNFSLKAGGVDYSFADELGLLLTNEKRQSFHEHLSQLQNQRDTIQYSNTDGLCKLEAPDEWLVMQRAYVFFMIYVFIGVYFPSEKQLFVQRCVNLLINCSLIRTSQPRPRISSPSIEIAGAGCLGACFQMEVPDECLVRTTR